MDNDLIARAQRGDADAFELIVRDRLQTCYATCLAILHSPDDARDATQEAFIAAWRRMPALRQPDHFDGWLRTIAINASRDQLRRRRRLREIPIEESHSERSSPSPGPRMDLESALDRLPPRGREVVERHYLRDEPVREISAGLHIPIGTVKSRLFHARALLREVLGGGDHQ